MLTIQNLHKLAGYRLKYEQQELKFRDDTLLLISYVRYKIGITYCNFPKSAPSHSWIIIYRHTNEMHINGRLFPFTLYDVRHIYNFVSFIGNQVFPPGFIICKP